MISPTSRYAATEVAEFASGSGRTVRYLRRRFVPAADRFALLQEHVVRDGDRLDNIAAAYLGDPEQFWRVADANGAMRPEELTEQPGRRLRLTLPEGIAGPTDV